MKPHDENRVFHVVIIILLLIILYFVYHNNINNKRRTFPMNVSAPVPHQKQYNTENNGINFSKPRISDSIPNSPLYKQDRDETNRIYC